MNYSTAIFLINKDVRAIAVTYEADKDAKREVFKTFDQNIAVDDYVIVQTDTRHKMTVCKVVEVDVDFDLSSSKQMEWVIGKVDTAAHLLILAQENQAIAAIKKAELRQKRESLRDALFKDHAETLKALPIAAMEGDKAAIESAA